MIGLDLARALRDAGVRWTPEPGDRFVIDAADLAGEIYWISELTVEVQRMKTGDVLGFNGTTEWALDSVTLDQSLWLPREDQLRTMLGDMFVSLARDGDWVLTTALDGDERVLRGEDPETLYATALLERLA